MRVLEHITRIYNKNDIPRWCGAYMIITKSGKRYIGSSENLRKRLFSHNNKDIKYIELYITDTVECARSLESDLILDLKPELNKTGKTLPKVAMKNITTMALSDNAHRRIRKIQNILFDKYEMDIHLSDILANILDEFVTEETVAEKIFLRVKNTNWKNLSIVEKNKMPLIKQN